MPSIGDIRVDFVADVTKFVSGVNLASTSVSRMAADMHKAVSGAEKVMAKFGSGMTTKVTAPIAAIAYAAVRAADTNGEAMKRIMETGNRASKAFAPVGEEIIKAFESARPSIEKLIQVGERAAKAFQKLPEPTKNLVIGAAAITAAVGPAALAVSSLLKVVGGATATIAATSNAFVGLTSGTTAFLAAANTGKLSGWFREFAAGNSVLAGTVVLLKLAGVAATALVGVELGRWAYDQFPLVQRFGATMVLAIDAFKAFVWDGLKYAAEGIKKTFDELAYYVPHAIGVMAKKTAEIIDKIIANGSMLPDSVLGKLKIASGALGSAGSFLQSRPDNTGDWWASMKDIDARRRAALKLPFQTWWQTQKDISNSPAGWLNNPKDPLQFMYEDAKKLKDALMGVMASGTAAAEQNTRVWTNWDTVLGGITTKFLGMAKYAAEINAKFTPEIDKLRQELGRLDVLAEAGLVGKGQPLSLENWQRARDQILADMARIQNAADEAFRKQREAVEKSYRGIGAALQSQYLQLYPEVAFQKDMEQLAALKDFYLANWDFINAKTVQDVINQKQANHNDEAEKDRATKAAKMASDSADSARKAMEAWEKTLSGKLYSGIASFSSNVGDAFAQMRKDGEFAFDKVGDAFLDMIIRTSMAQMTSPLFEWLGKGVASWVGTSAPSAVGSGGAAVGGPWGTTGYVQPHAAGGITNRPIATHLFGERGREVIAPLSQLPDLLSKAGLGGAGVQIIDMRGAGSPIQVRDSRGPDGRRIITAIIKDAAASGELDTIMSQRFNVRANPR